MSISPARKTARAAVAVSAVLLLAGCGEVAPNGGDQSAPRDLSGAISPTASAAAPTAEPGANGPAEERGRSDGAPTDFAPVDISLKDGGFAKSTPRVFHVPAGFMIILRVVADEQGPYRLSVISPSTAQTFKVSPKQTLRLTIDSLRSDQVAKIMLSGRTVRVAADAEPGP